MKRIVTLIVAVCSVMFAHAETTFYVSAETGSDDNDGLSWETATASIQKAIDMANAADTIVVSNGMYGAIRLATKNFRFQA